jgi:tetratricopeptide (TPR) repeat protein
MAMRGNSSRFCRCRSADYDCDAMSRGLGVFMLLAGLGLGCAHAATPTGGAWKEARSRHFVIQSDLDDHELEDFTLEFERSYVAIRSCIVPNGDDPPGVSRVLLLGNWEEYASIRHGSSAHFTIRRSPIETIPMIVLPARKRERMLEVFQHELVHRFIRHYFPPAPRWFHEGLAQFLSTATLEDDGVVVGREPARYQWDATRWMAYGMPLPDIGPKPKELVEMNSAIFMQEASRAYPGSWAFVHTLMLGEPEYRQTLGAYLGELRSATKPEPEVFARHFDQALLARIDESYEKLMVTQNLPTQVFPVTGAASTELAIRPMSSAEAFVMWGLQRLRTPDGRNQAILDAERAIAAEPRSPEGYLFRAMIRLEVGGVPDAVKDLRHALELRPGDVRLERALGMVLLKKKDAPDEVQTLAEKVRPRATTAGDFHFLALYELSKKREAQALDLALRATKQDEGCADCFETAALAASRTGDIERAVRLQEIAVNVASEFDDEMPKMLSKLERYRSKLAQRPGMP